MSPSFRAICEDLGHAGELAVADILRGRGHTVRLDGGNHLHDIVVNGSTTIEVKTALPSGRNGNRHDWWQFSLTKNDGHHAPMQEDLLILRCQLERDQGPAHHYVIPGSLLPRSLTKINITTPPPSLRREICPVSRRLGATRCHHCPPGSRRSPDPPGTGTTILGDAYMTTRAARARYGAQSPPTTINLQGRPATVQRIALDDLADWVEQHNVEVVDNVRIDELGDWPPVIVYRTREDT